MYYCVQVNRPLSMARTEIHSRRRRPKAFSMSSYSSMLSLPEAGASMKLAEAESENLSAAM